MNIPIHNLYYLLIYAWDLLDTRDMVDVSHLDMPNSGDLLAKLLELATQRLLRAGLDRGYVLHTEELAGIRGKLDLTSSIQRALLPRGRAQCSFDELSHDVLHNQILKATVGGLARNSDIDRKTRGKMSALYRKLGQVSDIHIDSSVFSRVQLHKNNAYYRLVINLCRMVHENSLVHEEDGSLRFQDFTRDVHKMRRLFEGFVRNFYARHTDEDVGAPHIAWQAIEGTEGALEYLPRMETDIVLKRAERTLLIDTKFSKTVFAGQFSKKRIKTSNLYQMYAYVKNMELSGKYSGSLQGMLLYPEVEEPVDVSFKLQGIPIRVATVDLNQPWQGIHDDLLDLVA